MAFDDDWDSEREDVEYFDAAAAQGHLLIIRAFDAPRYYRTENNPDGMVHPGRGKSFDPFPNTVVRCAVADLDADGGPRIYPESVLFPFSITKVAKNWVGKGPQLVMWRKGGRGQQTDPYELRNMRGDQAAVQAGTQFLADHPGFMELKAPEPYDERPPSKDRDRGRDDRDRGYDRPRDDYRRQRDDGWGREDSGNDWGDRRPARQEPRGYRDERDRPYDPRYSDRGREERPQRGGGYREDPWANQRPGAGPGNSYNRDDDRRDGSFLSRSRNHQGGFQDEEPPF